MGRTHICMICFAWIYLLVLFGIPALWLAAVVWENVDLRLNTLAARTCEQLREMTDACFDRERLILVNGQTFTREQYELGFISVVFCAAVVVYAGIYYRDKRRS